MIYSTQELSPIFDSMHEAIDTSTEKFFQQNTIARTIWLTMRIDGEIRNGGINQLLWNFHSDFSECIQDALVEVNADDVQDLINEFTKSADQDGPNYEREWDEIPDATLKLSNRLSDVFYNLQPSLASRVIDYANQYWDDKDFQKSIADLSFPKSDIGEQVFFLCEAVRNGGVKQAEGILKKIGHPNYIDQYGNCPVICIAGAPSTEAKIELVELFLKHDANINVMDKFGKTLLSEAMKDPAFVKFLIEKGADFKNKNKFLRTPIFNGTYSADATQILIDAGADIQLRCGNAMSPLSSALRAHSGWQGNKKKDAYQPQAREVIETLLAAGSTFSSDLISVPEKTTELALFIGDKEMLVYLLEHEGINCAPEFSSTHSGWSAVFEAVLKGNLESLKLLVEAGAKLNHTLDEPHFASKSYAGSRPLDLADDDAIEYYLKENGAEQGTRASYSVLMDTRGEEEAGVQIIMESLDLNLESALAKWNTVKKTANRSTEFVDGDLVIYSSLALQTFTSEEDSNKFIERLTKAGCESIVI